MVDENGSPDSSLRERAVRELRKRREFQTHLLVYVLVNSLLVVIWAMTSPGAFFWPIFSMLGWGVGVLVHAWDVYVTGEPDEAQIQRMVERLQRKS